MQALAVYWPEPAERRRIIMDCSFFSSGTNYFASLGNNLFRCHRSFVRSPSLSFSGRSLSRPILLLLLPCCRVYSLQPEDHFPVGWAFTVCHVGKFNYLIPIPTKFRSVRLLSEGWGGIRSSSTRPLLNMITSEVELLACSSALCARRISGPHFVSNHQNLYSLSPCSLPLLLSVCVFNFDQGIPGRFKTNFAISGCDRKWVVGKFRSEQIVFAEHRLFLLLLLYSCLDQPADANYLGK